MDIRHWKNLNAADYDVSSAVVELSALAEGFSPLGRVGKHTVQAYIIPL